MATAQKLNGHGTPTSLLVTLEDLFIALQRFPSGSVVSRNTYVVYTTRLYGGECCFSVFADSLPDWSNPDPIGTRNMTVTEYRDLISRVSDLWASAASGADAEEIESECCRLQKACWELRAAKCERATTNDKMKVIAILARTTEFLHVTRTQLNAKN